MKTNKGKGLLLALLCAGLLAGCGDAASSTTAIQPSDTASLSQEASQAEEPPSDTAAQSGEETSAEAELEPPLSEQDLQVPAPDFLPEDLQMLYRRAYKMMIIRIGTYAIDSTEYFPCDTPDTSLTYWDQLTLDGKNYAPALNHYQSWDLFYNTLDSIFTKILWKPVILLRTRPFISGRWRGGCIICPPSAAPIRGSVRIQPKWTLLFCRKRRIRWIFRSPPRMLWMRPGIRLSGRRGWMDWFLTPKPTPFPCDGRKMAGAFLSLTFHFNSVDRFLPTERAV